MTPLGRHICSAAVLGLVATSVGGQVPTNDRSGMSDLRYFARECLDAAPSFGSTVRSINMQQQTNRPVFAQAVPTLSLFEDGEKCVCAASFVDWHTHLPNVVQNLHYVVKDEARREWRAATTDPTEIELDFDGVPAFVRIGYQETTTDGILWVTTTVEREGKCPT